MKRNYPDGRFENLHHTQLGRYFYMVQGAWRVRHKVKAYIAKKSSRGGFSTRQCILREDVQKSIVEKLRSVCSAGANINSVLAKSLILGIVKEMQPDLIEKGFQASANWTRRFLQAHSMSWRLSTAVARKLPADFEDIKEKFLCRMALASESTPP